MLIKSSFYEKKNNLEINLGTARQFSSHIQEFDWFLFLIILRKNPMYKFLGLILLIHSKICSARLCQDGPGTND